MLLRALCLANLIFLLMYSPLGYVGIATPNDEINEIESTDLGFKTDTFDQDYKSIKRNIFVMSFLLILVILFIYLFNRFLAKKMTFNPNNIDEIKVISKRQLNSNLILFVVEIEGEKYLISSNNTAISMMQLANNKNEN